MTNKQRLISALILFYIYCAVLLAWPTSAPWKAELLRPILPVVNFVGAYHDLNLFGNPPRQSQRIAFEVFFSDETSSDWRFPRQKLSPEDSADAYVRYVTNYLVRTRVTKASVVWPDLARYIARQNDSPQRHPVRICFKMLSVKTPPPEQGMGQPLKEFDEFEEIFVYDVAAGDLP